MHSEKTGLEKSTLTSMLDRMEAEGKITRRYPAEDRRKVLIFLTERYRDLYDAAATAGFSLFFLTTGRG